MFENQEISQRDSVAAQTSICSDVNPYTAPLGDIFVEKHLVVSEKPRTNIRSVREIGAGAFLG